MPHRHAFSVADDLHYGGLLMVVAGAPAFMIAIARVLWWHRVPQTAAGTVLQKADTGEGRTG